MLVFRASRLGLLPESKRFCETSSGGDSHTVGRMGMALKQFSRTSQVAQIRKQTIVDRECFHSAYFDLILSSYRSENKPGFGVGSDQADSRPWLAVPQQTNFFRLSFLSCASNFRLLFLWISSFWQKRMDSFLLLFPIRNEKVHRMIGKCIVHHPGNDFSTKRQGNPFRFPHNCRSFAIRCKGDT